MQKIPGQGKKFPRTSLGPGMSRPSLTKENDSIPRSGTVQTEGRVSDLITQSNFTTRDAADCVG